jgi:hypothetical protein
VERVCHTGQAATRIHGCGLRNVEERPDRLAEDRANRENAHRFDREARRARPRRLRGRGFDDYVELHFTRGSETVSRTHSLHGEQYAREVLGLCWRIESTELDSIVIKLFPRA